LVTLAIPEQIVRRDRLALLAVGPADRLLVDELSGVADRDRKRRDVVLLHVRAGEVGHRAAFGGCRFGYLGRRLAKRTRRQGRRSQSTEERPAFQATRQGSENRRSMHQRRHLGVDLLQRLVGDLLDVALQMRRAPKNNNAVQLVRRRLLKRHVGESRYGDATWHVARSTK
jgi:hypothetical protein